MAENFNIAKFLKENALGSYGILGKYVDLKPLKEAEEGEENPWMEDVDGTDAYTIGDWKCYYGHPGNLMWSYKDVPFSKLAVYATPGFDGDNVTPIQVEVNGDTVAQSKINKATFSDFQEYAKAVEYALKKAEAYIDSIEEAKEDLGGWDGDGKNDQYDGKYDDESGPAITNELEKPEQIYTNDWMNDSIDGKTVGAWTCYYEEFQDVIYWIHDNINSEDVVVYATPGWDGAKGIACETSRDSGETVTDHETIGDNSYPDFESYANDVTPYLNKIEKKYGDMNEEVSISSSGVEMEGIDEGDVQYTSAEEFDLEPQEGPNDPLGPDASKYPRADFADAVYAANRSGISKDELIRLVNQNAR